MSYKVCFENISAIYNGQDYSYKWSDLMREESIDIIKSILFDHNNIAVSLEAGSENISKINDNMYFLAFEEGAVLFKLEVEENQGLPFARLQGMFFEHIYVTTAWLLIDRLKVLLQFINEAKYCELCEITENELDELAENSGLESQSEINPLGSVDLYSFAIGAKNPNITGVEFYPSMEIEVDNDKRADILSKTLGMEGNDEGPAKFNDYYLEKNAKKSFFSFLDKRNKSWEIIDDRLGDHKTIGNLENNINIQFQELLEKLS